MLGTENFLNEKDKNEKEKQRTWLLYSISESGEPCWIFHVLAENFLFLKQDNKEFEA